MRIHYLQHVPFEGLGYIAQWAKDHHYGVTKTRLYEEQPFPEVSSFDCLVVMGGPMGVHDTSEHKWLTREKHFIDTALKAGIRILGICLGAQLIADVLGAKVYPNTEKEIGWHPVSRTPSVQDTPWAEFLPGTFVPFHWHGDTFDLPTGAFHLAQSRACAHQAFYYPPGVVGLQFHLESTKESIEQLILNCGDELVSAAHIQSADEIRRNNDFIHSSNLVMGAIMDHLVTL